MLTVLTAALLVFSDPAGDARGDGGYVLPTRPAVSEEALDLRAFRVEPGQDSTRPDSTRFTVELGRIDNPWGVAAGFSAGVTDIFVGSRVGGQRALNGLNLQATGGGWTYHLRVSASGGTLEHHPEGAAQPVRLAAPTVRRAGNALVIDAAIPPGRWAYWVTSSVYTPLSPDGVLRPVTVPGPARLQVARPDAPVPVDVLLPSGDPSPFTRGTLPPVGDRWDPRLLILAGLGGLGLLLVTWATVLVWRRNP